ncbi:MAG: GNAT family N-acetyltransferase [Candidatus Zixiibacteriota bacterium]
MTDTPYRIVTAFEDGSLRQANFDNARLVWPTFMLHDIMGDYFADLFTVPELSKYQFAFIEDKTERIILMGNSIPLRFDGELSELPDKGWDWGIEKGVLDSRAGIEPNMVMAIQIMIPPDGRGKGLSVHGVTAMRKIASGHGFSDLIAPVRPNMKSKYPLVPFEKYIYWTNGERLPFDPWMRVHARMGAKIIKPAHHSMLIHGPIADWEEWTDMKFPESGEYVIDGALNPISIDVEENKGVYHEPNVWMHHRL